MDDIIVIILTLIFIVASIFGQKKKRQPVTETEAEAEAEPQSSGDNFWDMLNEEWKEARQTDAPSQQKPVEKQEQPTVESKPYTFHPDKEGAKITVEKPEETKKSIRKTKKKKFPLRDAVIYSEILNRKYT
ncbi:hypothetical protein [Mariniphaga sp.]|uniref:hypothetical protein n=1 Tax=Mariniphaga sp. TaxID=1954475 RepID=UPI003569C309